MKKLAFVAVFVLVLFGCMGFTCNKPCSELCVTACDLVPQDSLKEVCKATCATKIVDTDCNNLVVNKIDSVIDWVKGFLNAHKTSVPVMDGGK